MRKYKHLTKEEKNELKSIGEYCKIERIKNNHTRKDLSLLSGISITTLQNFEYGKTNNLLAYIAYQTNYGVNIYGKLD